MKKIFITALMASAISFANAQDMMSKKGTPILPESGDWSIGFDATSPLMYFGNLFNNTEDNSVNADPQIQNTLVGKYMADENTAYRVMLRIGFGSTTDNAFVTQDGSTSTPPATVTDTRKSSGMDITIGAGMQKYRGKGRLKGFYGAQAGIMLGTSKDTYTYGNSFSSTNQNPTIWDWQQGYEMGATSRPTEWKDGSTFGFWANGFIGGEYFFAPKLSLSAEYGWGLNLNSTGEGEITTESANGTGSTSNTTKTGKSSSFGLDVINSGSITLSLYF